MVAGLMSRVTYECDNGVRFIFLTDSRGNEVVDMFFPGFYMQRMSIDECLRMLRAEQRRRKPEVS